jgi:hypothetical protein
MHTLPSKFPTKFEFIQNVLYTGTIIFPLCKKKKILDAYVKNKILNNSRWNSF